MVEVDACHEEQQYGAGGRGVESGADVTAADTPGACESRSCPTLPAWCASARAEHLGVRDAGGGARQAIIGTLEQVGLATLFSVPFGLLVSVYVVEYGRGRLASTIRFFVDVMTGIPSIVATTR